MLTLQLNNRRFLVGTKSRKSEKGLLFFCTQNGRKGLIEDLKKLDDDNVYRKMQGHWIIEMAEMSMVK